MESTNLKLFHPAVQPSTEILKLKGEHRDFSRAPTSGRIRPNHFKLQAFDLNPDYLFLSPPIIQYL